MFVCDFVGLAGTEKKRRPEAPQLLDTTTENNDPIEENSCTLDTSREDDLLGVPSIRALATTHFVQFTTYDICLRQRALQECSKAIWKREAELLVLGRSAAMTVPPAELSH